MYHGFIMGKGGGGRRVKKYAAVKEPVMLLWFELALFPGPLRRKGGLVHTVYACTRLSVKVFINHSLLGRLFQALTARQQI